MLSSVVCSIPLLFLFATLPNFLPSVCAQTKVTCISNYAELKQSLFENGTGNMERLLYAFTAPNLALPHYIWVYYFYNQSSEWSDILTCPPSQALQRCPTDNEYAKQDDYHLVFWADSPMLINIDIPLLKMLSYNSILQYLESGTCVQLVIPPFCESVDLDSETEMIKFATSYLRSYSTSRQESERDYILDCADKFGTEFAYDEFLLCSQIIVCFGSGLLFVFLSFQLCSIKPSSRRHPSVSATNKTTKRTGKKDVISLKDFAKSCKKCNIAVEVDATFEMHKAHLSVAFLVNITAISFLITDAVQFSVNSEILREAFWYSYGSLNIILFGITSFAIFIGIPAYFANLIVFFIVKFFKEDFCCRRTPYQHEKCHIYNVILSTLLTLISFIYILSRTFLIALAIATYPFQVGFILLAIGSGFVALLFVVWAAVHVALINQHANVGLLSTIFSLVPYGALLLILTGFLVSYIFVILRLNIRLGDPVTSLVSALVPTIIGFVAASRYKSALTKIKAGDSNDDAATEPQMGKKHSLQKGERADVPLQDIETNV